MELIWDCCFGVFLLRESLESKCFVLYIDSYRLCSFEGGSM
jgi:hypothetical protein